MFDVLFGNSTINKVLLYLCQNKEGYARQIARNFSLPVNMVQKQIEKLENAGILESRFIGRTRLYRWNEKYLFRTELLALLRKAFDVMTEKEVKRFYVKKEFSKP